MCKEKQLTRDDYIWREQTCPVCNAAPTRLVGKRGGKSHVSARGVECEVWKCLDCKLFFPNPMPIPMRGVVQHYNVEAEDYFHAHDYSVRLQYATSLVKRAEALLGRKGRLLEVGVGRGEVLVAAKEAGWACEGVEPSPTFAKVAEERTGVRIWNEAIEDSEIADESFDIVILAAVLEHLYDPDIVIERISRILTPGGLLFVDVPNEDGLYFRMGNFYQRLRGRDWCVNLAPTFEPYHIFGFTPRALKKLLTKHGLTPDLFQVYPGTSMVEGGSGFFGWVERFAAGVITSVSRVGQMGTYIEAWARK